MGNDAFFEQAILEATEAANLAGDQWFLDKGFIPGEIKYCGMLDLCGGAYINLRDRRTTFAKWLKKKSQNNQVWSVGIDHKYRGRQEMGLNETTIRAAIEVLQNKFGITGIAMKSYID